MYDTVVIIALGKKKDKNCFDSLDRTFSALMKRRAGIFYQLTKLLLSYIAIWKWQNFPKLSWMSINAEMFLAPKCNNACVINVFLTRGSSGSHTLSFYLLLDMKCNETTR